MQLAKIFFKNFRNFNEETFEFSPHLTVILGENTMGKTNILEGVHFIVNAEGFRESKEEHLINYNSLDNSYVEGLFKAGDSTLRLTIAMVRNGDIFNKNLMINKAKKRTIDYRKETTKTVLFSPEQLDIIIGEPSRRREYFNQVISYFDVEYKKRLKNYENAIRRRNKLLEKYTNLETLKESLVFWNDYLIEQAFYITEKREEYMDFLNKHPYIDHKEFKIQYLKNELTAETLKKSFEREILVRRTLVGPQKDDFQIHLKDKNVHNFGSRSEQRFAILWLKMNEVLFYEEKFEKKPILLLDDIFSELDSKNKKVVLELIKKYQTIATTTEEEILELTDGPKHIINL